MERSKSKTRAVGRPATGQKVQAQCRLDPPDLERLNEHAAAAGLPQSTLTRMIVLEYLNDPHPLMLTPERVTISDIPLPPSVRPTRHAPAHTTAHRTSNAHFPETSASSRSIKKLR